MDKNTLILQQTGAFLKKEMYPLFVLGWPRKSTNKLVDQEEWVISKKSKVEIKEFAEYKEIK